MTGRIAAATVVAFALAAGGASAQARFEMVDQNAIAGAPGVRLIALRDNVLKTCYVMFVADVDGASDAVPRPDVADIPSAQATRDRRLADLLRGFEQEVGAVPGTIVPNPLKYEWLANAANIEFALTVLAHEFARLEQQLDLAGAASRRAVTAVPAPCTPPAPQSTEHLPAKGR